MFERIKKSRAAAGDGGFTLIELLVVIIILGILAAVVVFAVGGVGDKGQKSACRIDTRTIRTAQEAYAAQPTTATPPGGGGSYGTMAQLQSGGFLSEASEYHGVTPVADPDGVAGPLLPSFTVQALDSRCGGPGTVNGTSIF